MASGGMEIKQHQGTYAGFVTMMKVGTVISAAVGMIVILLIAH